jgi:hypothetical protein
LSQDPDAVFAEEWFLIGKPRRNAVAFVVERGLSMQKTVIDVNGAQKTPALLEMVLAGLEKLK